MNSGETQSGGSGESEMKREGKRRASKKVERPGKPDQIGIVRVGFGRGFGLFFAALGVLIFGASFILMCHVYGAQHWVETTGYVRSVELEQRRAGKESVIWSIRCEYTYTWRMMPYTGTRVAMHDAMTKKYDHEPHYDFLKKQLDRMSPITVYVNPANPHESTIYRNIYGHLPLGGLVGLLMILTGFSMSDEMLKPWREFRRLRMIEADSVRPWRTVPEFRGFILHSHDVFGLMPGVAAAIVSSLVVSIFWMSYWAVELSLGWWILMGLLGSMALASVMLKWRAIYQAFHNIKYGRPRLLMTQMPLATGREFAALLVVNREVRLTERFVVELACIRKKRMQSGKSTTFEQERVGYIQQKYDLKKEPGRGFAPLPGRRGVGLAIVMTVPGDLPGRQEAEYPMHVWQLRVWGVTRGIDFFAEFDLPVYQVTDEGLIERNPEMSTAARWTD